MYFTYLPKTFFDNDIAFNPTLPLLYDQYFLTRELLKI